MEAENTLIHSKLLNILREEKMKSTDFEICCGDDELPTRTHSQGPLALLFTNNDAGLHNTFM